MTKPLRDQVALVAGATRGAGRGIARMLGEAGATVWCTGRSARGAPAVGTPREKRPETIEETAALVDAAGGRGIAARVDHGVPTEVEALVRRIEAEHGRLDVLVTVLGALPVTDYGPSWEQSTDDGWRLVEAWLRPQLVTCRAALPTMVRRRTGLVAAVVEGDALGIQQQLYFDLAHTGIKRLMYDLAEELAPHGVAAVSLAPGFMRTEEVLDSFPATEANWQEVAVTSKAARDFGLAGSETPNFVGRAVAALAADPDRRRWSGRVCSSAELAAAYGFTDVDGRTPNWPSYFATNFPQYAAPPRTGRRWAVMRVEG